MDEKRFETAKKKIIGQAREREGIGTLREKTLHAVLKHYYAPDENMHEVPIGPYVADIYTGDAILEIQNGNFYKIRTKLDVFLAQYPVTVIYPIPHCKWLVWVDEETGELSPEPSELLPASVETNALTSPSAEAPEPAPAAAVESACSSHRSIKSRISGQQRMRIRFAARHRSLKSVLTRA